MYPKKKCENLPFRERGNSILQIDTARIWPLNIANAQDTLMMTTYIWSKELCQNK